jgi:sialate O-acetylesterase
LDVVDHHPPRMRKLAAFLLLPLSLRAGVSLAPLFTDHAVLQRDKPLPIWGWAAPGEKVRVSFASQTIGATADQSGKWLVVLDPLPANSTGGDLSAAGQTTATAADVVVGDIWLCSGQSNMEFPVRDVENAAAEINTGNFPLIRQLALPPSLQKAPSEKFSGNSNWVAATPASVGSFSAVAYFFARDLQPRLNIPIGLINASAGDAEIESWIAASAFANTPELKPNREPAALFNGMIAPLLPTALRGFLWYQGESDAYRPREYAAQQRLLIRSWRTYFAQGDLPFFFVQLPNFKAGNGFGTDWAILRDEQAEALMLPNTGMAVTIDLGDPNNLHPRNKQEVGRRLSLIARKEIYGMNVDDSGPVFSGAEREGTAFRIHFTHAGTGLTAEDHPVSCFQIAGFDRKFYPASARIEGETVVVSAREVISPVAVRYAWFNDPDANLYNGAGLPARPFRTDNW